MFEHPEVGTFTMEIDLGWCQFTGSGWYVSGGRLVRSMAPRSKTRGSGGRGSCRACAGLIRLGGASPPVRCCRLSLHPFWE